MELASGHKASRLEGNELEEQMSDWKGITNGFVRLDPGRWLFPADYLLFAEGLYNFQFKQDDVLIMTWPKCGTTWAQEIVWTMRHNSALNHPERNKPINIRVPFIDCDMFLRSSLLPPPDPENSVAKEFQKLCPGKNPEKGFFLQLGGAVPQPRTLKVHLPISLFPPNLLDITKIIYVGRHPKDVVVSYDHHCRVFKSMSYVGSYDRFVDYFVRDDLIYGPYWLHLKEAWEVRNHPNMHFMFFEDMKKDIFSQLKKLNAFLETGLNDDQLEKVCQYTSFEEMKHRDNVFKEKSETDIFSNDDYTNTHGGFYRKGDTGSWKSKLTTEQSKKIDAWMDKHLNPLGISWASGHSQQTDAGLMTSKRSSEINCLEQLEAVSHERS